jgi:hypothetical protein
VAYSLLVAVTATVIVLGTFVVLAFKSS